MYRVVGLLLFLKRDGVGRRRKICWHGYRGNRRVLCVGIVGCMEETEPMGDGPGLDGMNATGKDATAPSSPFVS